VPRTTLKPPQLHSQSGAAPLLSPLSVDPIEYIQDAFDKCVVPTLTGSSPVQLSLRIHLYRKLVGDLARQELALITLGSIDDLFALCWRCFEHIGCT
jgi:hypothetical protein